MENQLTRNAFNLDFKREVDVALCILRFSVLESWNLTPKYIQLTFIIIFITGNGLVTKISRTFLDFNHLGHEFCVISGQFHSRHAGHAKPNATGFPIGMPGMPNPMQLASRSACPASQTRRADRRVTSNNPRNNCRTHFGSSPLLVTKVARNFGLQPSTEAKDEKWIQIKR